MERSKLALDWEDARRRVCMPVLGAGTGMEGGGREVESDESGDEDFLGVLVGRGGATCERIAAAYHSKWASKKKDRVTSKHIHHPKFVPSRKGKKTIELRCLPRGAGPADVSRAKTWMLRANEDYAPNDASRD